MRVQEVWGELEGVQKVSRELVGVQEVWGAQLGVQELWVELVGVKTVWGGAGGCAAGVRGGRWWMCRRCGVSC